MPLNNNLIQLNLSRIPLNCLILCMSILFGCSLMAWAYNYYFTQYLGNNYFPENMLLLVLLVALFNLGLRVYYGPQSDGSRKGVELALFVVIMSLLAFATNAVQFTPFSPIDMAILQWEHALNVNMPALMDWSSRIPFFHSFLVFVYDSLTYQMSIIPLLLIALGRYDTLHNYYFLLLSTVLLGFIFYYFFPTTAPASVISSSLFAPEQLATGLKFREIHQHLQPSTIEGGLIALPSFHVIWALLCVYMLKEWWLPCAILFVVNCLLICSCVLLGWHYVVDVVAGVLLLFGCYFLLVFGRGLRPSSVTA